MATHPGRMLPEPVTRDGYPSGSWWITASRDEFDAAQAAQAERMRNSRFGRLASCLPTGPNGAPTRFPGYRTHIAKDEDIV